MPRLNALQESYKYCREIARTRARNFYFSFVMLPPEQRDAMCAVYAFMRYCDDLSDEPGATQSAMDRWSSALRDALDGHPDAHPVWPAFLDAVERYKIPHEYFHAMIEGVASDLKPVHIATFEDLYQYCYRVASVVGLTTIHIFGFTSPEAIPLAEKCGIAFQLTNILRDVKEDADLGRTYIPAEDLQRFGVTVADLRAGRRSEAFGRLMEFEIDRARSYYQASQPLLGLIQPKTRRSLWTLITIYSRLLERVSEARFDVLTRRISLSVFEKLWIMLRAAFM